VINLTKNGILHLEANQITRLLKMKQDSRDIC